jgi:protein O-mannosyl-transferase
VSERASLGWTALALAGAVAVLYAPVAGFEFVTFDDPEYVYRNRHVLDGLGWAGVVWAFGAGYAANWHPLTWLSHMADASLFGTWAGGHHLTSVALHAASAAVLLVAVERLGGRRWEAVVVAAAFALHPLRVESVAWVSERKDVLAALAWVGAMLAYAGWARRPSAPRYALVAAVFALGLLAKPMVVTLPFALVLLDVWPLGRVTRHGWRRVVVEKVPLFALSVVASIVTYRVQAGAGAVASLDQQPVLHRVGNALVSYVAYLAKTVWPADLAMFYPQALLHGGEVLGAAAVLLAVTLLALREAPRRPYLLVGWLWFLGTLVPVIGIVRAGEQAMADRFTYVPGIGLAIMAAWGAGELARRGDRAWWAVTAAAALVLLAWTARTRAQLATWRDSPTLYRHALAVTEGNHVAHGNLGLLLLEEGRVDEAMAHFRAAVAARPLSAKMHVNLGVGLATLGRHDEAIAEYETALRLDGRLPLAHYNLGIELAERGRLDEAVARYEEAIRLDPEYALPRVNLGLALANRGRVEEAIAHYRAAIALDPTLVPAYNNLAVALERSGSVREALDAYRTAVRLQPGDPRARFNLGSVLLGQGQAAEAAAQYREVVRLDPSVPEAHAALGEALARTGDVDGATAAFRRALERRPDWPEVVERLTQLDATAPAAER